MFRVATCIALMMSVVAAAAIPSPRHIIEFDLPARRTVVLGHRAWTLFSDGHVIAWNMDDRTETARTRIPRDDAASLLTYEMVHMDAMDDLVIIGTCWAREDKKLPGMDANAGVLFRVKTDGLVAKAPIVLNEELTTDLAVSDDQVRIAFGHKRLVLMDAATNQVVKERRPVFNAEGERITGIAIIDGVVVAGTSDGQLCVWNHADDTFKQYTVSEYLLFDIAGFVDNGRLFAVYTDREGAHCWDTHREERIASAQLGTRAIVVTIDEFNGRRVAYLGLRSGFCTWLIDQDHAVSRRFDVSGGDEAFVRDIDVVNGMVVVTVEGAEKGWVELWDRESLLSFHE